MHHKKQLTTRVKTTAQGERTRSLKFL